MNSRRHIEADERGITISKALAWTMVVGLVTAGVWGGRSLGSIDGKVSSLGEAVKMLREDLAEAEDEMRENARRINTVEQRQSADRARDAEISRILERIDARLVGIDQRLREQERQ